MSLHPANLALRLSITLCLALPALAADQSQFPITSSAQLSEMRSASAHLRGPNASTADLQESARQLDTGLAWLDANRERMNGAPALLNERINLQLARAGVLARLGRKDEALAALEETQTLLWLPQLRRALRENPDFASLRDEPRFQAVLATSRAPERAMQTKALTTIYKDELSIEERVAGLSLFWAEARHGFAHFDNVPALNWDQVYMDYLRKVIAARDTREYYRVMMQLAPLLRDGHTNIYPPRELTAEFFSTPPLDTALAEGKVHVRAVLSASLAERVRVGDEIVSIDGMPVKQYAEEKVAPFASYSTPQDRDARLYTHQLLAGAADQPVGLGLRGKDGVLREESVARSGWSDWKAPAPFSFRMLAGDVAYVELRTFENEEVVEAFLNALPKIIQAKALILDLRYNGGGNGGYGLRILSHLSSQPIPLAASYARIDSAVERTHHGNYFHWLPIGSGAPYHRPQKYPFTGPVAVLTGPQTYSAAEDMVLSFRAMRRGVTVGTATGGSTGQALNFALPGGGRARICVKRDLLPDGGKFVGLGIAPQVEVRSTLEDVRAGRDPVLERALQIVSQ
ncbi:S41 family peptidase [Pseudoduganella violacea]|uniref:C-terminal processing protease CtpA/Prc n=1 Tax=Pseudoduganella violacea TaxID=1715466 RepID=A0A7W5FTC3_9BURK|nr:S41 family peptidase [Pseudoduganella violacea]MBB3118700.1 C-terminal processing protease CtpA/Prc [Pseudoduganella violacea]